ncbi:MAG: hypothetical protein ACYSSO_07395 [Planctomycetota bacterium]|jgi:hypothetical protein
MSEVIKLVTESFNIAIEALSKIEGGTTDQVPPFRAMGATQMQDIAKQARLDIRNIRIAHNATCPPDHKL